METKLLTHNGSIHVDEFCLFVEARSSEIREACVASLAEKHYLQITFVNSIILSRMKEICSEYCSTQASVGTVAVSFVDATSEFSSLLNTAKADRNVYTWSRADNLHGATPTAFGEIHKALHQAENALQAFLRCLDPSGELNRGQASNTTPPPEPKLLYSDLNLGNARQFCDDAAATVIWNIVTSPQTHFSKYPLERTARAIVDLAKQCSLESGLALTLLVHWSKCSSDEMTKEFTYAVGLLRKKPLTIAELDPVQADIARRAENILKSAPLTRLLLKNTGFSNPSVLDRVKIHFVNVEILEVKGWAAPGCVVVNLMGLRTTLHLKSLGPTVALFGHELRHVLLRMANGGDFNFSSPEKEGMATPSLAAPFRESRYWFELEAIGAKFRFPDGDLDVDELITAIEDGLVGGHVPALTPEQVDRYSRLHLPPNEELAFDYESLISFCY